MSGAPLLCLYASQTGNSRGMAKEIASRAVERGYAARSLGMEQWKTLDFDNEPTILVIASSTGNGDCPDNGDKFHRYCKRKTTPAFLSATRFTVLALGDSNYEAFCAVGKEFDKHFERLGGQRFLKRCDVDEVDGIEETVEPWMEKLWTALKALPAPSGAGLAAAAAEPTPTTAAATGAQLIELAAADLSGDDDAVGRSAARPLLAPVVAARWLTSSASSGGALGSEGTRRVLHVEVDVSRGGKAMGFTPGDALGIVPENEPAAVAALLKRLGTSASAPMPSLSDDVPAHLQGCATVGEAFTSRLDLGTVSAWPPLPLLRLLLAGAPSGSGPLREVAEIAVGQRTAATGPRAAHATLHSARVSLEELLDGLGVSAPPALPKLLDALPPLAPRYYSIANAPAADPGRIHLCLSIVDFYATLPGSEKRHLRSGLASSFIARACAPLLGGAAGQKLAAPPQLPVFRREPSGNELRLPADPTTPIVLIGPGTGLAPFRGFLQQRKIEFARSKLGECHVFFGCRREDVRTLHART
uniref:Methionine synthase reductase n=1 Tax=Haptolina brevifila TaxID=156173 RepID=A0A7S2DTY9_9EUKA